MTTSETEKPHEYGLQLWREQTHLGLVRTEYVKLRLCRRDEKYFHPIGCGNELYESQTPKHLRGLSLDGLGLDGFISSSVPHNFIGADACEYRDIYSIDRAKADRMSRTLRRVSARVLRDKSHEPGDVMMSLVRALRLTFVVEQVHRSSVMPSVAGDWRWMSCEQGRERYRAMIDEARADHIRRGVAA
jgi:hypothetical protein